METNTSAIYENLEEHYKKEVKRKGILEVIIGHSEQLGMDTTFERKMIKKSVDNQMVIIDQMGLYAHDIDRLFK